MSLRKYIYLEIVDDVRDEMINNIGLVDSWLAVGSCIIYINLCFFDNHDCGEFIQYKNMNIKC